VACVVIFLFVQDRFNGGIRFGSFTETTFMMYLVVVSVAWVFIAAHRVLLHLHIKKQKSLV